MEVTKDTAQVLAAKSNVFSLSKFENAKAQDTGLDWANEVTEAAAVRDSYGCRGEGVKIGQIESKVP